MHSTQQISICSENQRYFDLTISHWLLYQMDIHFGVLQVSRRDMSREHAVMLADKSQRGPRDVQQICFRPMQWSLVATNTRSRFFASLATVPPVNKRILATASSGSSLNQPRPSVYQSSRDAVSCRYVPLISVVSLSEESFNRNRADPIVVCFLRRDLHEIHGL